MATKQRADKQKEKERKEKIILIALVGVLIVVGAIELPKMLKSGGSSGTTVSAGQVTTSSTSTSPGTSTGGMPTSTSSGALGPLPDASGYEPGAGQLSRFSLFKSDDPFGDAATAAGSTSTRPSSTSSGTRSTATNPQGDYVAAKITINGTSEIVAPGATFPAASPVFTLDSLTAKKIEISVAGGSFASGQSKVTVKKGKSVVLVNTVDSTRYSIKFVTALTASQLASTTTATTTGTTTGGTTTSGTTGGTTAGTTTSVTTT